jgi:Fe-S-cluster containining protein
VTENPPLSCLNCAAFCCKLAGYVEVRRADIRRLAKFLGLTVPEFEAKHLVEKTRKGEKLIKSGYDTCQFLGPDRRCTVYEARPTDCRQYICWDQYDPTVYEYARFYQQPIATQQGDEAAKREAERNRRAEQRRKRQRQGKRRRG